MDDPDYVFDDLGLILEDFVSFPEDGILLPICWEYDEAHFLSIP